VSEIAQAGVRFLGLGLGLGPEAPPPNGTRHFSLSLFLHPPVENSSEN